MPNPININLLKNRTVGPDFLAPITVQLRRFSIMTLLVVVLAGAVTASVFFVFQVQNRMLASEKERLDAQLLSQKEKESIYYAMRSRIAVVDNAIGAIKPYAQALDMIYEIVTPPSLLSFATTDQGRMNISIQAGSIDDVFAATARLLTLAGTGRLGQPTLEAFSIDKTSGMRLSFSFIPNFK